VRQEDGSHLWIGPDMADASTAGGDERTEQLVGKSDRGFAHGLSPGIDVHELHTSRTLAGRAFRSSEPVTFNAQDPQTGYASLAPAEGRAVVREGIKSAVAVQLSSTRRTYGCLVLCSTDPLPTVSPEDIALTQVIAGQVAVAIERAQLYEDTKQRAAESEALYLFGQKLAARNAVEAAK
jgi:GAF domain-containing protein